MSTSAIRVGTPYTPAPRHEAKDPKVEAFYGHLLRGCTHKLNNQLAVIQGFSSLLQMNDDLDESDQENIGHMKEAAQNASKLSERVLAAAGITNFSTEEMNLTEMLAMSDSDIRAPFAAAEVPFELQVAEGLPLANSDARRLKDIIMELLRNAADAAKAGGGSAGLKVHDGGEMIEAGKGFIEVVVRNTGSVIPPEKFEEIWQPFYSTRTSNHLGLGLPLAAGYAASMDLPFGFHSADNTTTFCVGVPIA